MSTEIEYVFPPSNSRNIKEHVAKLRKCAPPHLKCVRFQDLKLNDTLSQCFIMGRVESEPKFYHHRNGDHYVIMVLIDVSVALIEDRKCPVEVELMNEFAILGYCIKPGSLLLLSGVQVNPYRGSLCHKARLQVSARPQSNLNFKLSFMPLKEHVGTSLSSRRLKVETSNIADLKIRKDLGGEFTILGVVILATDFRKSCKNEYLSFVMIVDCSVNAVSVNAAEKSFSSVNGPLVIVHWSDVLLRKYAKGDVVKISNLKVRKYRHLLIGLFSKNCHSIQFCYKPNDKMVVVSSHSQSEVHPEDCQKVTELFTSWLANFKNQPYDDLEQHMLAQLSSFYMQSEAEIIIESTCVNFVEDEAAQNCQDQFNDGTSIKDSIETLALMKQDALSCTSSVTVKCAVNQLNGSEKRCHDRDKERNLLANHARAVSTELVEIAMPNGIVEKYLIYVPYQPVESVRCPLVKSVQTLNDSKHQQGMPSESPDAYRCEAGQRRPLPELKDKCVLEKRHHVVEEVSKLTPNKVRVLTSTPIEIPGENGFQEQHQTDVPFQSLQTDEHPLIGLVHPVNDSEHRQEISLISPVASHSDDSQCGLTAVINDKCVENNATKMCENNRITQDETTEKNSEFRKNSGTCSVKASCPSGCFQDQGLKKKESEPYLGDLKLIEVNRGMYFNINCQAVACYVLLERNQVLLKVWDGTKIPKSLQPFDHYLKRTIFEDENLSEIEDFCVGIFVHDEHKEKAIHILVQSILQLRNVHAFPISNDENSLFRLVIHTGRIKQRGIYLLDAQSAIAKEMKWSLIVLRENIADCALINKLHDSSVEKDDPVVENMDISTSDFDIFEDLKVNFDVRQSPHSLRPNQPSVPMETKVAMKPETNRNGHLKLKTLFPTRTCSTVISGCQLNHSSVAVITASAVPSYFCFMGGLINIYPKADRVMDLVKWSCEHCRQVVNYEDVKGLEPINKYTYYCKCHRRKPPNLKDAKHILKPTFYFQVQMCDMHYQRLTAYIQGSQAEMFFHNYSPENFLESEDVRQQFICLLKRLCRNPQQLTKSSFVIHCRLRSNLSTKGDIMYSIVDTKLNPFADIIEMI